MVSILLRSLLLIGFCVLSPSMTRAAPVWTAHAKAELIAPFEAVQAGQKFWVALRLIPEDGWHTYWRNPGDSGLPTALDWQDLPKGVELGDLQWMPPSRLLIFDLMNYGYNGESLNLIHVQIPADYSASTLTLKAHASWLICKDVCLPEEADLELELPIAANASPSIWHDKIVTAVETLDALQPLEGAFSVTSDNNLMLELPANTLKMNNVDDVYFYSYEGGVITHNAVQAFTLQADHLILTTKSEKGADISQLRGLLEVSTGASSPTYYEITAQRGEVGASLPPSGEVAIAADGAEGEGMTLIVALLVAFIGGIILNAMPCVFPVLSLKALALTQKAHGDRAHVRREGLAYTAGVVVTFMLVAVVLIALKSAGAAIGWGYQMQSPLFVAGLAYLMLVIGLNLSGVFELRVVMGGGDKWLHRHDLLGHAATGVLTTVLATPCTAPFMATAIGFALTQNVAISLAVFAALGLGLAAPFLLFSYVPALLKWMPKPGLWMVRCRQFLAFPIYLSVVWLLWVLAQQVDMHHQLLTWLGLLGIIFTMWLWNIRQTSNSIVLAFLVVVSFIISVLPLYELRGADALTPQAVDEGQYESFSQKRLDTLRAEGRPVFVNATAAWCITCKVNEKLVLKSSEFAAFLADKNVAYLVADWTNNNPEITAFLERFGRSGVPLYVYYPVNGSPVVLSQILTKSDFEALE